MPKNRWLWSKENFKWNNSLVCSNGQPGCSVTLQQQGLKVFPKKLHNQLIKMNNDSLNFKRWKANAKGVDLNRQCDVGWETIVGNPGKPYYNNFKGKRPESAAEVKAVLKLVKEIDPQISVTYHSTGKIIYWNYLQTGSRYHHDYALAKQLSKMTGYSLVYPRGIPSGGGFTDWFVHKLKRLGFTIEISRYYYETNPPFSEFPDVWRENRRSDYLLHAKARSCINKNSLIR